MRRAAYLFVGISLGLFVSLLAAQQSAAQQKKPFLVERIEVEGNQRIEPETVFAYITLTPGERYAPEDIDQALKSLFLTGFFSDVRIIRRGTTLVVEVQENPLVNSIAFEGNSSLDDEELKDTVSLQERSVYNQAKLLNSVQNMVQRYQAAGYFSVDIDPQIIRLSQNRINLVFKIDEREATRIHSINIIGNRAFSDIALLSEIRTSTSRWWKLLASTDIYSPQQFELDQNLLNNFYGRRGYADFEILAAYAEIDKDRGGFFLTLVLDEGDLYSFGEAWFVSELETLDPEQFRTSIAHSKGDIYDNQKITESLENITFELGQQGYAFAQVRPKIVKKDQKVDVEYVIARGPQVYVERIDINGNVRTVDSILRRQFVFSEGDVFNRLLLARSLRNLRALGFFSDVQMIPRRGSQEDKVVIDVDVEETYTGEVTLGVSYSSSEDFVGDVGIREQNFLGRALVVGVNLAYSAERLAVNVNFVEPYFLGQDLSLGINGFWQNRDYSSYSRSLGGAAVSFGFPLWENTRLSLRVAYYDENIYGVSAGASPTIRLSAGKFERMVLSYIYHLDHRNDVIQPTEGWDFRLEQDYSGLIGSVDYFSTEVETRFYHSFADGWVGLLKLTGGYIVGLHGDDVGFGSRYQKGGTSFRGFEWRGIGPRDLATGDALGSNSYFIGTAQLAIPMIFLNELGISLAIFTDFGFMGKNDLESTARIANSLDPRVSAGFSILWTSPVGPLRFDFARALLQEDYDQEEFFRFNIGTSF